MKRIALSIALTIGIAATAYAGFITTLMTNASSTGAGSPVQFAQLNPQIPMANQWFQATLNGASAVSASVRIEGSTDDVNWVPIATITLPNSVTAATTDAASTNQTAPWIRANLTAISGVGASVTVISGE
jgi:hypothetical protein